MPYWQSVKKIKVVTYGAALVLLSLINGCSSDGQNSTPTPELINTREISTEQSFTSTGTASLPTPPSKEPEPLTNLVSLDSLGAGEYLILRGNDPLNNQGALYIVSSQGLYMGQLDTGHDFADAAISPTHEWLAYVDGFNERSSLHVKLIRTGMEFAIGSGCKNPSWSPNGDYLAAVCGEIVVFSFSDGAWKRSKSMPLPSDFPELPANVVKSIQWISPSWSADGKSISYYVIFPALPPEDSVLGPYISSTSCFFEETTCQTYELDTGEIQPWPMLQRLQTSDRLAIYSYSENQSNLYLFDVENAQTVQTIPLTDYYLIDSFTFSPSEEFLAFKPSTDSAFIMNLSKQTISKITAPISIEGLQVLFWIRIA
jgi:hypothetical protein